MFRPKLKTHNYWLRDTLKLIQLDETSVETVPDYYGWWIKYSHRELTKFCFYPNKANTQFPKCISMWFQKGMPAWFIDSNHVSQRPNLYFQNLLSNVLLKQIKFQQNIDFTKILVIISTLRNTRTHYSVKVIKCVYGEHKHIPKSYRGVEGVLILSISRVILKCKCIDSKASEHISMDIRADKREGTQRSRLLCTAPRLGALILSALQIHPPSFCFANVQTHT